LRVNATVRGDGALLKGTALTGRHLQRACSNLIVYLLACSLAWGVSADRDKAWDKLIDQAKAHGGVETRLEKSSSYVFQRQDGSYVSFTRLFASEKGRSVCLIAKDENATACVDWDTGKLTLGSRADPATPWKFRSVASLDAFEAEQPGIFDKFVSTIKRLLSSGKRSRRQSAGG
jgi:hypothetical protein